MSTLSTSQYVPVGAYIGQIIRPRPTTLTGTPRIPCYVGVGDRLAFGRNLAIRRSYITEETLTFSTTPPHLATLAFTSDGDQTTSRIYLANGREVPRSAWSYFTNNTQILLNLTDYSATSTYYIDYQSTLRTPTDPMPLDEIREVVGVSKSVDQDDYEVFVDFLIDTEISAPAAGATNTYTNEAFYAIDHYPTIGVAGPPAVYYPAGATTNVVKDATTGLPLAVAYMGRGTAATAVAAGPSIIANDTGMMFIAVATGLAGEGIEIVLNDMIGPAAIVETLGGGANGTGIVRIDYIAAATTAAAIVTLINTTSTLLTARLVDPDIGGAGAGIGVLAAGDDTTDTVTTVVNAPVANTGRGNILYLDSAMTVTGAYDRDVAFTFDTINAGDLTNDIVHWVSTPASGGNSQAPRSPINTISDAVAVVGNILTFTGAATDTLAAGTGSPAAFYPIANPATQGIVLRTFQGAVGTAAYIVTDDLTLTLYGPGRLEVDDRYSNTNQFASLGAITSVSPNVVPTHATTSDFTGTYNRRYYVVCHAVAGGASSTWSWYAVGDDGAATNVTAALLISTATNVALDHGVVVTMTASAIDAVIGNYFTFEVNAPLLWHTALDDRAYTAIPTGTPTVADVDWFFSTDTLEGRFGVWTAADTVPDELPDSVFLATRNLRTTGTDFVPYVATDSFTFSLTNNDVIDWSLETEAAETTAAGDIIHDIIGTVTGTANTFYLILRYAPSAATGKIMSVVDSLGTPVAYTQLLDGGTPTNYIWFATDPGDDVTVTYRHRGQEPSPGELYYFSGYFLRDATLYDDPQLSLTIDEARILLAPNSADNHLYNMAELAFANDPPAIYTVQVNDLDQDEVYNDVDFRRAITASETSDQISDLIVLSNWTTLGDAMTSVDHMNDPFEKKERLGWYGCPTGTPVGTASTVDTLVYYAKNSLQVFGNSPAHGTRILVAPTECDLEITLPDNTTTDVTYDGSFVAGATAALVAGLADPADTILRKTLAGFDAIETFTKAQNILLGDAGILYLADLGTSIFRFEESTTVDFFAPDFNEISAMTQKQYVTKYIRTQMDSALIAMVPPSAEAGVATVSSYVIQLLTGLLNQGKIASYQDAEGNTRAIDPTADVVAFRDTTTPTLYHFNYAYWIRYPIKRLYGLYSVDSNDFGAI